MLRRHEHPESDVELALADEQGPLDVLLQDEDVRFDISCVHCRLLLLLVSITVSLVRICSVAAGRRSAILVIVLRLLSVRCTCRRVQVISLSKILELLSLCTRCVLEDQPLQLVDRVEEVDSAAAVGVCRLEKPHVVPIVKRRAHRDRRRLALLLTQLIVL